MCLKKFNVGYMPDGIAVIAVSPSASGQKQRKIIILSLEWIFILLFKHYMKPVKIPTEAFYQLNSKIEVGELKMVRGCKSGA